ncbi:TetR/AcrR family transcriptional regulator [Kineococcus gypseus]|uniref:TetR/AcrR family transcriptional regulator n=1 Tax=Kineococcus gypseus TaxID=1637102 RepID=UPI003D7C96E9
MVAAASAYHRQVAAEKRASILAAATRLFVGSGHAGTSLAAVAAEANVSKATLFKQFPTKAALFDAIVRDYWAAEDGAASQPDTGDLRRGPATIGHRYVALLTRPGMADLFRTVMAELPRFPGFGQTHFDLGEQPFYDSVVRYLLAERSAGTAEVADVDIAATEFLGMVSNHVLWPEMLLLDWARTPESTVRTVEEAALTMHARYGASRDARP